MSAEACPRCNRTDIFMWVSRGPGQPNICAKCDAIESREAAAMLKTVGRKTLPLIVRQQTTVGFFSKTFPTRDGNCCTLLTSDELEADEFPRQWCRNMNAENVDEAAKRWPELVAGVECESLEDGTVRVVDSRIPPEWRKHTCSVHGFWES